MIGDKLDNPKITYAGIAKGLNGLSFQRKTIGMQSSRFSVFNIKAKYSNNDDINSIDEIVKEYDKLCGLNFYEWIKSSDNLDYIALYMQKYLNEVYPISRGIDSEMPDSIEFFRYSKAIAWIVRSWTANATAQFIIKIFFPSTNALESPRLALFLTHFHSLIPWKTANGLSVNMEKLLELYTYLTYGESPKAVSIFMVNLSKIRSSLSHISKDFVKNLIVYLAEEHCWSYDFCSKFKEFAAAFTQRNQCNKIQ